jgi:hypothetical protein
MPNWRKVLLSGSKAAVYDITASNLPSEPDKTTDVVVISDTGHFLTANRNDFGAASGPNKAIQFAYTEDNVVFQNSGSDKFTFDEESVELIISAAGEGQINIGRTDKPSSSETLGSLNFVGTGSFTMEGPTAKIEAVATQDYTVHAKGGKLNFYTSDNGDVGTPSGLDLKMIISKSGVIFNTNISASSYISASNAYFAGPSHISNGTGKPTLTLDRQSGQASISSSDWFIADSKGGVKGAALNYYNDAKVILANGGGNVGVGIFDSENPGEKLEVRGNISASNDIYADTYYVNNLNSIQGGLGVIRFGYDPNWARTSIGYAGNSIKLNTNVTASGDVSASGTIVGSNLSGTNTGDQSLVHLAVTSSNVLFGHITSSGNISASGQLIAGTAAIPNMDAAGSNSNYQTVVRNPNTGILLYTGSYGSGGGGGTGDVSVSGTPSDNQIAVWTDSSTIEGTATLSLVGSSTPILGSNNSNFEVHANRFAMDNDANTFIGSGGADIMRLVAGGVTQIEISDFSGQSLKLPQLAAQSSTVSLNIDLGNGGIVGYRQSGSSRKIKKDIIYLDNTSMLTTDDFDKIKPVVFKYKEGITSDKFKGGFIAEDLAEINPILAEFSDKNETNPINIEDRSILALCVLKIKELEKEIEYLKTKIS